MRLEAQATDTMVLYLKHGDQVSPVVEHFAWCRDMSGQLQHQAGHCLKADVLYAESDIFLQLADVQAAIALKLRRADAPNHHRLALVIATNVANHLLGKIANGHQANHAAIFVNHHRHRYVLLTQLIQQLADRL